LFTYLQVQSQTISDIGYIEKGKASYYPDNRNNALTRSGERYDMNELAAAHPYIQYNCLLKITNLDNNKEIFVRVNDRPYTTQVKLMLTLEAAKQLGMIGKPFAEVKIEIVAQNSKRKQVSPPSLKLLNENDVQIDSTVLHDAKQKDLGIFTEKKETEKKDAQTYISTDMEKFKNVGTYSLSGQKLNFSGYGLQVAIYEDINKAFSEATIFQDMLFRDVVIQTGWAEKKKVYRVMIGQLNSKENADKAVKLLSTKNIKAIVKPHLK
jgi:rare lipoprotein A